MKRASDSELIRRKADHIDLAFASQADDVMRDERFYYEPVLSGHPAPEETVPTEFLGKSLKFPIWVSSMTGGTERAGMINRNLARMCGEFGLGMGLGSCRILLEHPELLPDFNVRDEIGPDLPLYANLGLAQAEGLLRKKETERISDLVQLLRADGLIIHINPLQEWLQPDGDRFQHPPIDTIRQLMDATGVPLIVKEVGQGMGPRSLAALFALPLAAVELAAHGGTNFATLELLRDDDPMRREHLGTMARVGHSAEEMISFVNNISDELRGKMQCKSVIISGGVRSFLDGFYLMKKLTLPSIYGQASGFLKYAQQDYPALRAFAHLQTTGLRLAYAYLRVK